jgi:hypothetical protein
MWQARGWGVGEGCLEADHLNSYNKPKEGEPTADEVSLAATS